MEHRPDPWEPDEVARRQIVRFLFKLGILNYEKHFRIMMRIRTRH